MDALVADDGDAQQHSDSRDSSFNPFAGTSNLRTRANQVLGRAAETDPQAQLDVNMDGSQIYASSMQGSTGPAKFCSAL